MRRGWREDRRDLRRRHRRAAAKEVRGAGLGLLDVVWFYREGDGAGGNQEGDKVVNLPDGREEIEDEPERKYINERTSEAALGPERNFGVGADVIKHEAFLDDPTHGREDGPRRRKRLFGSMRLHAVIAWDKGYGFLVSSFGC